MKQSLTVLTALAVGVTLMAGTAAIAAPKKSVARQLTGTLNLNTATLQQLDAMPGVGPKAAERIVAFRAKTPFSRAEDLVKVKGFGKKKLEKLKAHLSVSGPTTLKVSTEVSEPVQGRPSPPTR